MRAASWFAAAAAIAVLGPGIARASEGRIGVYADLTATQRSATFSLGVPRTLFIIAQLDGLTASGMTGAEFRADGLPHDWVAFVTPNPAAPVVLGDPFRLVNGVHRANIAFAECTFGTEGRVLLYTVVIIANSAVESGDLVVLGGDPPANPAWPVPLLTRCDFPEFSLVVAQGDSFHIGTRAPQDLDYSQLSGYDGERGVQPERGLPGDVFHFRVFYSSADALPPAEGSPRLELDVNGDGDALDPFEGVYTMSAADLDSTLLDGKEYRFDVALGEPPGGSYRYRFTATDSRRATVPGPATVWRGSLLVNDELADLSVYAEEIRAVPPAPETDDVCSIVATIHNRSDRQVDGVTVRIETVHGTAIAERTLASLPPQSTTEVACTWTFTTVGFQPVVVRVDPENAIVERDELDNVATHGVYVGGAGISGDLIVDGVPGLVTVPPAAPFALRGSARYPAGTVPSLPARGVGVIATPTWDDVLTTRTDAGGEFSASFTAPAAPGSYGITLSITDGATTQDRTVSLLVSTSGGAWQPHGPNLAMQLSAVPDAGCPAAAAMLSGSVANRGDVAAAPAAVRILSGGTSTVTEVLLGAIAPGATLALDPVVVPLAGPGLHSFTAHVDPGDVQRELREDDNASVATVRVPVDCLDLALDEMRFTSAALCSSAVIAASVRVVNRGCVGSEPARVAWRVGGTEVASAALAGLAPGEAAVLSFARPFDLDCHDVDFVLDPEGTAGPDCDTGNNLLAASLCTAHCPPPPQPPPPPRPDFAVFACDVRASNSRPAAGEPLQFAAWIENRGPADATIPVFVRFELDGALVGDPVPIDPLVSGARMQVASAASWPADFVPHELVVAVDPNGQEEVSPANSWARRVLPYDLLAYPIGHCPPSTPSMFSTCAPCQGVPIEIRAVVVNDGLFDCDSVQVEFRDEVHGGAVIGRAMARDVLGNGGCVALPDPVSFSQALTWMGPQRITAVVDPQNVLPERDETNNTHTGVVGVACTATPDLVAAVRLPVGSNPTPGDTVRAVEVQVTNQGTLGAFGVVARLELDGLPLGDLQMGDLAPGASSTSICTTPWVVIPGCSQRLEACADPDNQINESNESNNCASRGHGFSETDLGIHATLIEITPSDPEAGEQVSIDVGVYSALGVPSTCLLTAEWSFAGHDWQPIGSVPLHVPGSIEVFPDIASFVWTVPAPDLHLRFRLLDVCPFDIEFGNDEAEGTLPWFPVKDVPVVVSDLEAESMLDGVVIRWRAEAAVAAFVLERRTAEETRWERLPESIPVAGGSGVAAYELLDRSAQLGARLEYRLLGRMSDGSEELLGNVSVVHDATGLGAVQLLAVRPNPFHPGNAFEFTLPEPRDVELCVFDAAGRRIAALRNGPQAAGRYAVSWDGRDTAGRRVPAGVYFCRFVAGSFQQARRFVLVH